MDLERDHDGRDPHERLNVEQRRDRLWDPNTSTLSRERDLIRHRNQAFQISPREMDALRTIGRFRTVAVTDLVKHAYGGQSRQLRDDLKSLAAQGLLQQRSALTRRGKQTLEVVVLTKTGKSLLERPGECEGQALYAGFVKRSEVAHDAAIYGMFQAERKRIERAGGRVQRIVLDYELKRLAYTPLAKARPTLPPKEFAKRQAAVAQEYGLSLVESRLVLPDLRIEYVTPDDRLARVDLELATEHYHGSHLAAKAAAGFRFYAADGSAARLSRVLEERQIAASILSL
jgi:hypothetical protein